MGYRNLTACLADLERTGQLVRIEQEIDPHLEAAEVQRRVYRAGGPAILFARVKGTPFPMTSNMFGTLARARFLFRDTLDSVRKLVELKTDPGSLRHQPWRYWNVPLIAWHLRPRFVRSGPILAHTTTLSQLPQLKCWPLDGGAFVTLPQVYTEHPDRPGWRHSNLGTYRVQFSGNDYEPDQECGLHYQIHRGIGVHHAAALRRGEPLRVNVAIGGPPALTLAAVMPLPETLPELAFAGVLGGRRVRMCVPRHSRTPSQKSPHPPTPSPRGRGGYDLLPLSPGERGLGGEGSSLERGLGGEGSSLERGLGGEGLLPMPAEVDFVISGFINPTETKPEGPFGDHLGYYSLTHDFPVMKVTGVYHRPGAIWPFTVVGRPPQEDTSFGALIHEMTGPVIPTVIPGLHAVHAVDAAGVHPCLLALGSERYVPYAATRKPQELLTLANAILGQGQLSLAKYLFIAAKEDNPELNVHDVVAFFRHVLERFDPTTDLHFQTHTTIDTLDYSAGMGLNAGSKVAIAAAGPKRRSLATEVPVRLKLPDGFSDPRLVTPGVLTIRGPKARTRRTERGTGEQDLDLTRLTLFLSPQHLTLGALPLIVVVDDSEFAAQSLNNWLWVTFTRSDPAQDVHGVGAFVQSKHWGCRGPVVIDARIKPHAAPPLEEDPAVARRVDRLFARGGPLSGIEG